MHCTPDELMAVADGSRDPASVPHLAGCDLCRDECEQVRQVLADVRDVAVPEPSSLYWDQLSARVRDSVAADRSSSPPEDELRWWHPARLAWPATVAMAVVLAAVFVTPWLLTVREMAQPMDSSATTEVAAGFDPPDRASGRGPDRTELSAASGGADESIGLMLELAGSLDVDAVLSAGLATTDGVADGAVADLSSDERSELARLIREALGGAGA